MEAEDLVINEGGKGEIIEQIREELPNIGIAVLSEAFIVETINLRNLARLVISTQDRNTGWVSYLEGNEESNGFYGVVTSINIITYTHSSDYFMQNGKGSVYP